MLLDEFLHNVLRAAQSLTTDKLRAGLLGVLPTTLGKEALLEAEVELRAYWDRTKGRRAAEDDKDSFDLKWAFEVRRVASRVRFGLTIVFAVIALKVSGVFHLE